MERTIAEIMSKKMETIEESATVQQLAIKMKENNVSSLLVVDSLGNSKGLVTERDVVRKVCVKDVCTSKVIIKEIMSLPLITINPNDSPSTAIGIITPRDLTKYQEFTRDDDNKDYLEKILEYFI